MNYQIDINDYIGAYCFSKQYVKNQLSNFKGKPVNVRISSLGGSVEHGLDIRQQFIDHGDVTAYLYGMVASSATIVSLGAKKVCISKYCMFLVHKVSNWVDAWGQYNADQIEELIEQLKQNKLQNDKFDLVLANMYADKCKKKVSDILDILKEGKWMTAQEAKDYGFVDEIIEGDEDKINYSAFVGKLNIMGLTPLPENVINTPSNSLLDKIYNGVNSLLNAKKENNRNNKPIDKIMNKDFTQVNQLLNVEGLEFNNEGKVTLSKEQIEAINNKLNAKPKENDDDTRMKEKDNKISSLETSITEKDNKITELTAKIEDLEKKPGDDSKEKVDDADDNEASLTSAQDLFNSVKDIV